MILSYRKTKEGTSKPTNFEYKIKRGEKIHTILADVKTRWKVGMKIQQANGVRNKYYNCFQENICTGVQSIKIECPTEYMNDVKIYVDDRLLNIDEMIELAHNDGFDCLGEFLLWFNEDFEGKIINWTDKRY
ncbi:hypothetical protein [Saccharicrinis fermentans]|uniref:Uncharacterized protein n=1 Tax=Saccharicrinis fermentans DSM 9555 = JCM 21142 TaxID=869213 RepID=W7YEX0_9BACT|nr:hypothetical protein [Saccharicrinis fermentans]GAF06023.1 hypothetical protein JCM21142_134790 [Saccharicrinis fermentans DSM 9555 = JCM 21142]